MASGVMEANSADAVAGELLEQQITPVDIRPAAGDAGSGRSKSRGHAAMQVSITDRLNAMLARNKVAIEELIIFSRQMYSLTKAGMPLDRALKGLYASQKNLYLRRILAEVTEDLENGQNLSTALGRHPKVFSQLFLSLVNVGENTGQLDMAFQQIGIYLELERNTRKQIKSATRYPTFVVAVIAVALAVITYFVIPAFSDTFARLGAELPLETRILIAVSDFVVAWWHLLLGVGLGGYFGLRHWARSATGRPQWDRYKLRLPLVGAIFERIALARFSRAFAMIMKAGVPIVHGMSVVAGAVGNEFVARRVLGMRDGISRGEALYRTALQAGMFSPLVLQMMAVGEESGSIDQLMEEVADFYDAEVEYDLKRLGDAIEPVLIMFIAGLVLILALGVFLPIWDLGSAAL